MRRNLFSHTLTVFSLLFMTLFRIILKPIDLVRYYKSFNIVHSSLIEKFEILNKMEEKLNTMMGQTKSESLNMISSVKLFSREDLHLEEQSLALHKMKDAMVTKNFFRFIVFPYNQKF